MPRLEGLPPLWKEVSLVSGTTFLHVNTLSLGTETKPKVSTYFEHVMTSKRSWYIGTTFFIYMLSTWKNTSNICFTQEKWSALYNVRSLLLSIQSLLAGKTNEIEYCSLSIRPSRVEVLSLPSSLVLRLEINRRKGRKRIFLSLLYSFLSLLFLQTLI